MPVNNKQSWLHALYVSALFHQFAIATILLSFVIDKHPSAYQVRLEQFSSFAVHLAIALVLVSSALLFGISLKKHRLSFRESISLALVSAVMIAFYPTVFSAFFYPLTVLTYALFFLTSGTYITLLLTYLINTTVHLFNSRQCQL